MNPISFSLHSLSLLLVQRLLPIYVCSAWGTTFFYSLLLPPPTTPPSLQRVYNKSLTLERNATFTKKKVPRTHASTMQPTHDRPVSFPLQSSRIHLFSHNRFYYRGRRPPPFTCCATNAFFLPIISSSFLYFIRHIRFDCVFLLLLFDCALSRR